MGYILYFFFWGGGIFPWVLFPRAFFIEPTQSHNEIRSDHRICREKTFSLRNHAENQAWSLVPNLFLFFQKALCKVKASGQ